MVKSNSCFRLITCGGGDDDAAGKQDHQEVSEVKDSNDKRGWSFRKRSARHRVLSNTVITETPSSEKKETSECTSIDFQSPAEPNVVEKNCTTNISDEKPRLSSIASSEVLEMIVTETEGKVDVNQPESVEGKVDENPPESVVLIVQAAIRGYLAQRALIKNKNVVKLQAAVRGHLVRRNAVGTLRCVQAIVKMQLLVRARHVQQSHYEDRLFHNDGKKDYTKTSDNEHHVTKSNVRHTSIEKLLNNQFARQLLESEPKNKPIRVKCDPSKADSAWKWLERWMTISAKDSAKNKEPICKSEHYDETKDSTHVPQSKSGIPSEVILQLPDSKPTLGEPPLPTDDEEKAATHDAKNSNFQASPSSFLAKDNSEQDPPETADDAKVVAFAEIDSLQNEKSQTDASVPQGHSSLPHELEIDGEPYKQSMKTSASDLETEGKQLAHGSKSGNPAFIAAQSKFKELSLMANSGGSSSWSNQDAIESQADTSSAVTDTAYKSKELFLADNSALYPSRIGGSECGVELSMSSTLESPDRSEVSNMESEHDAKGLVEGTVNPENKIENGVEANTPSATSSILISDLNQLEIVNDTSGNIVDSVVPENSKEPGVEPEKNAPDLSREQLDTVSQDFKLSPEASPASHMTIPESQGTPSSQVSMKPKENKINKSGSSSNRRRKLAVGNKSPVSANHDSGSRGSREKVPKDQANGKRRNSFGSVKPDHSDQEPRDSSNNDSVPRFMKATESARAKINANSSPRSSPDVHDIHIKKRHSLPGATGRQGSPRVEHSPPQAQLGTKGNGVHGIHERKWQR